MFMADLFIIANKLIIIKLINLLSVQKMSVAYDKYCGDH